MEEEGRGLDTDYGQGSMLMIFDRIRVGVR